MTNKVEVLFFGNTKDLQRSLRTLDQQFGGVEKQVTTLADRAIGAGDRMSRTLTPALAAAGIAAIKMASDQEQAYGALDSQLGEHTDTVRKFGDTAADSYGLSREQVSRLGAITAAQLKAFGFANEEAAATTVELQKRGADLAATFGGPVEDAVGAIGALLRGERDPIERYGVALKQVDINAELARQKLDHLEGEERKLAEAQVALTLFMEQTASAAGQFGREAETTAGQTARATAKAKDLAAELGDQLLPIAVDVLGTVNNVADAFAALPDPMKAGIVQAALFAGALGPLLSIGGRLVQTLTPLAQGFKQLYEAWALGRSIAGKQTASLAAVGGAVGGVTIAVGAAIAVWQKHQQEQAASRARIEEITDTLDEQTGAITENTRTWAANRLEQTGALTAAQKFGIELSLLTDAALGNSQAQAELDARLGDIARRLKENKDSSDAARAAYVNFGRDISPITSAIRDTAEEADAASDRFDRLKEANFGVSESASDVAQAAAKQDAVLGGLVAGTLPDAIDGARYHAEALEEEGEAADEAAEEFGTLADRIRNATNAKLEAANPTFRAMEAERRAAEAVDKYHEALADGESTLADRQAALDDVVIAQGELEAAQAEAIGTTDDATARIREWGRQAGLSEDEIDGLVERVGALSEHLNNLKGTYTANVQVVDATGGKRVTVGQIGFEHDGGVITRSSPGAGFGLKPNERLTALEVGEEVLTEGDPRHRDNLARAGGGSPIAPSSRQMERMMQEQTDVLRGLHTGISDLLAEQRTAHARASLTRPPRDLAWEVLR